jgi:hypothetical protein
MMIKTEKETKSEIEMRIKSPNKKTPDRVICKIFQLEYNDHIDIISLLMDVKYEIADLTRERDLANTKLKCQDDLIEFLKEQIEYLRKRD